MVTDGIVEAQDAKQQLFGFDRAAQRMELNFWVANAAQIGQEDDISVISVTKTRVFTPALT
jgi:hypothetical protein